MSIAGIIIAGGEARRLGGEKALLAFGGATLLDAAIRVAQPQVNVLALNLRAGTDVQTSLPVVVDRWNAGPLSGVISGLSWARALQGIEWLATFPVDVPFLPGDLVANLASAAAAGHPVVVHDGNRLQNLCALWPIDCLPVLLSGLAEGRMKSLRDAHAALNAVVCPIKAADRAFLNINTPDDLALARSVAESSMP